MQNEQLVSRLNGKFLSLRLSALKKIKSNEKADSTLVPSERNAGINLNLDTSLSIYGYCPTASIYNAYKNGAVVLGMVGHSSYSVFKELRLAAKILDLIYFCGEVTDCSLKIKDKTEINSVCCFGVPHKYVKEFDADLEVCRQYNKDYVYQARTFLNQKIKKYKLNISVADVLSARVNNSDTDTTENLCLALAKKVAAKFEKTDAALEFLTENLKYTLTEEEKTRISDRKSSLYLYDLYKIFSQRINFDGVKRSVIKLDNFVNLCNKYSAVMAIKYNSDHTIEENAEALQKYGVHAVWLDIEKYSDEELGKIYDLFYEKNILVIGRKIISYPRDTYSETIKDTNVRYKYNLSTLAIVGHEIAVSINETDGMYSEDSLRRFPSLEERIRLYSRIGMKGRNV